MNSTFKVEFNIETIVKLIFFDLITKPQIKKTAKLWFVLIENVRLVGVFHKIFGLLIVNKKPIHLLFLETLSLINLLKSSNKQAIKKMFILFGLDFIPFRMSRILQSKRLA